MLPKDLMFLNQCCENCQRDNISMMSPPRHLPTNACFVITNVKLGNSSGTAQHQPAMRPIAVIRTTHSSTPGHDFPGLGTARPRLSRICNNSRTVASGPKFAPFFCNGSFSGLAHPGGGSWGDPRIGFLGPLLQRGNSITKLCTTRSTFPSDPGGGSLGTLEVGGPGALKDTILIMEPP